MLSRTADHLYWLSRSMERAENVARFLDVANRQALSSGDSESWQPVLSIAGGTESYRARFGEVTAVGVVTYAVLDHDNPSSIIGCLRSARENAHAGRSVIPHELWETINAVWLQVKSLDGARLRDQGLPAFCDWVKERSHLFRGVTYGTMLRNEPYQFLRLGTFLERADDTARLLAVRGDGVTAASRTADAAEHLHWGAVLRSVSAYKAYRTLAKGDVSPAGVAEMLILNADMPRSLHACLDQVTMILERLSAACECTRVAGGLHAELHFGRLDRLLRDGLDGFVADFLAENNTLAKQIQSDFLMTA
ncbi:MAG: alpha-E domain-containing protein [Magnetospirillum sp.]|nr:alpha-E domain-containing protein [Magnetospirillum sp.]